MANDSDLREIEELTEIKPSDDVQGTSGDQLGGSLTIDEGKDDPREKFFSMYTKEGKADSADPESTKDEDEEIEDTVTDVEPQEGADTDDDESKDPDSTEDTETTDDDDNEDIDLEIDLSDIDVDSDEEEEQGDVDFDPRQDLSKKIWKSTPKEAQALITSHRQNAKRLERTVKDNSAHADWSRDLFDNAKKAGTSNEQLMDLIETGFRLNAAAQNGKMDAEAAQKFGEVALANGFKFETEHVAMDLDNVQTYLQEQIDGMAIPLETAKEIMSLIKKSETVHKEASGKAKQIAAPVQHQRNWTDPENNGQPIDQSEAVRDAAVGKIAAMQQKFEKRFGKDWPKLEKRIRADVVAQQSSNPLSPQKWPSIWKKTAEKHSKQFLKLSKAQKGRSRMDSQSESLGRGAPLIGTDSGVELTPREEFHRKHSK